VFTARYALSPYIKQICFVFKGLKKQYARAKVKRNCNVSVTLRSDLSCASLKRKVICLVRQSCSTICINPYMIYTLAYKSFNVLTLTGGFTDDAACQIYIISEANLVSMRFQNNESFVESKKAEVSYL
jgi:hypothetical protein